MEQHIFLVRHGETEWTLSGQHTSRTDIALTPEGRRQAELIGQALRGRKFIVFTSPLTRARETCRLAGFGDSPQVEEDLHEWDYGVYEGKTTAEIRQENPDWSVWTSPIVGGESIGQVAERARRMIDRALAQAPNDVALFGHGHILRILGVCWIDQPPITGQRLGLDPATISVLGYERETRVIRLWNVKPGG
jgi:broad specificity phosphatase PhoE